MDAPIGFSMLEDYALFRPQGEVTLEKGVAQITHALRYCAEQRIKAVLVDTLLLTGFRQPTTIDRYELSQTWAAAAQTVVVAVLMRPELIDPERFGVQVARNRGALMDVFSSEVEAIAWLRNLSRET